MKVSQGNIPRVRQYQEELVAKASEFSAQVPTSAALQLQLDAVLSDIDEARLQLKNGEDSPVDLNSLPGRRID